MAAINCVTGVLQETPGHRIHRYSVDRGNADLNTMAMRNQQNSLCLPTIEYEIAATMFPSQAEIAISRALSIRDCSTNRTSSAFNLVNALSLHALWRVF